MIDLYSAPTPNGWKASIMLEEIGLDYKVIPLNLGNNDQKQPDYLKLNPNGRIPTIVDRDNDDFAVFETGAILVYLAEKTGMLLPSDVKTRSRALQWTFFQVGGIGPMQGQAHVFKKYWPVHLEEVINRYHQESMRLYKVLDDRLAESEYLAGNEYTIADIASFPWIYIHEWAGLSLEGLQHLQRWHDQILERPAVQGGLQNPPRLEESERLRRAKLMTIQ